MKYPTPLLLLATSGVRAWHIGFYLGPSCTSQSLYSVVYDEDTSCMGLPEAAANAQSVIASASGDNDGDFVAIFFGTDDCTGRPISTAAETICVPNQRDNIKSYEIRRNDKKRRTTPAGKRTPKQVHAEIEGLFADKGLNLYSRDIKPNSTDLMPAKTYEVSQMAEGGVLSAHPYLAISLSVLGGALGMSSLASGCISAWSGTPLNVYECLAGLGATAITWTLSAINAYDNAQPFFAWLHNNGVSIDLRPWAKRDLEGAPLTLSHEEYMEYLLEVAGIKGTHVGYHDRRGFKSSVYEFGSSNGEKYHVHMWPGVDGEVRHSISFARDSLIEKRQGYEGVTVRGGLDIVICEHTGGDYGDLPDSAEEAYDYVYADIECLVSEDDFKNGEILQTDVMDRAGKTLLTISMTPWLSQSDTNYAAQIDACPSESFHFDQTCIN